MSKQLCETFDRVMELDQPDQVSNSMDATESMLLDGMTQLDLQHNTDAGSVNPETLLAASSEALNVSSKSSLTTRTKEDNDSEGDTEDEDITTTSVERHVELLGWKKTKPTSIIKRGNIPKSVLISRRASKPSDERSLHRVAREKAKLDHARARLLELLERQPRKRGLNGRS
ncbi:hypothetical protein OCU04_001245 [Sclerotinia nivalis]|uniref:Uncharacterized protein n=1 Tax=Sclerotinia nivalis TaxID=352851 RepID=A0A9X0AXR4_9HELO|nr:hypothetical protein OCU04_001245 [Sclerotinia nivalis]